MDTGTFTTVVDKMTFTEGPRWHNDALYFSDFYTNAVYRASVDDGIVTKIVDVPGRPSGLGWLPDGTLLIVSQHGREVLKVVDGRVETYCDLKHLVTGNPNDMIVLADGTVYLGDLGMDPTDVENIGYGIFVVISPKGIAGVAGRNVRFPNGIVQLSDGRLVLAESFGNRLSVFDPSVGELPLERKDFAAFGDFCDSRSLGELVAAAVVAPDGLAVDEEDAVWVADCFHNRVIRVREGGEILQEIDLGDVQPYAVALGGSDGRELFVCVAPTPFEHERSVTREGKIVRTRVDVPAAR